MRKRSLETLRRDAAKSCKLRGHSMRWSKPFEKSSRGHAQQGDCRLCGAWVQVQDYCSANEIDIGGPAVAIGCKPRNRDEMKLKKAIASTPRGGRGSTRRRAMPTHPHSRELEELAVMVTRLGYTPDKQDDISDTYYLTRTARNTRCTAGSRIR